MCSVLTFKVSVTPVVDEILKYVLVFHRKCLEISCKSPDDSHECQDLFSVKSKKKDRLVCHNVAWHFNG